MTFHFDDYKFVRVAKLGSDPSRTQNAILVSLSLIRIGGSIYLSELHISDDILCKISIFT